jgi:hypothetical protein
LNQQLAFVHTGSVSYFEPGYAATDFWAHHNTASGSDRPYSLRIIFDALGHGCPHLDRNGPTWTAGSTPLTTTRAGHRRTASLTSGSLTGRRSRRRGGCLQATVALYVPSQNTRSQ